MGMTSFRKEKGGKKESVTFKSVLSKSYCVPLALLCWPFLAERDLGLSLAKPGLVWCQLLGSFPENLSFFGKRVLGTWLPARIRLQSFPDSARLRLCSVHTPALRDLQWGAESDLEGWAAHASGKFLLNSSLPRELRVLSAGMGADPPAPQSHQLQTGCTGAALEQGFGGCAVGRSNGPWI